MGGIRKRSSAGEDRGAPVERGGGHPPTKGVLKRGIEKVKGAVKRGRVWKGRGGKGKGSSHPDWGREERGKFN